MMVIRKFGRVLAVGTLVGSLAACDDLLDVQDPSRFTDDDLDRALQAVATGVEGDLQIGLDSRINDSEIMADVMQHTGTWAGWDDIDHGRIRYDQDGRWDGGSFLMQTRFAAIDASERFDRLEAANETVDPALRAQVEVSEGWTEIYMAQWMCEAPGEPGGGVITDMQLWTQARDKLTAALATANDAGATDYALWARAGIARAELMLGNYPAADAAATAVLNNAPPGWMKEALFEVSTASNAIVTLSTFDFNHASGIREKWWPLVDDDEQQMEDPISGELDPRVPIRHEAGVLGVDGVTEFYSQWKYTDEGADIPITHLDEMRLIQAEAAWADGDLSGAMTILNGLRTAVGLSPAVAATSAEVLDVLLNERFAELFMEGQRANDLDRFDLVPALMAAGDFVGTEDPRAIKFPMSSSEGLNNPNIEDDAAVRCTPLASSL